MDRILLLDFDGPLWSDRVIRYHPDNNDNNHPTLINLREKMIENGDTFVARIVTYWRMDDTAVGMLNNIMKIQPFKTVVSSSWRDLCSKETIEHIFAINNLQLDLHDDWHTELSPTGHSTESKMYEDRLIQCQRWIKKHQDEIDDYVILDDPGSGGSLISDSMCESVGIDPDKVVIVNYEIGLEIDHYLEIHNILTK
jgi:hypothetical protein